MHFALPLLVPIRQDDRAAGRITLYRVPARLDLNPNAYPLKSPTEEHVMGFLAWDWYCFSLRSLPLTQNLKP